MRIAWQIFLSHNERADKTVVQKGFLHPNSRQKSWKVGGSRIPTSRGRFFFWRRARAGTVFLSSSSSRCVYDSLEPETFRVQFNSRSFSFLFCRCCSCLSNSECELLLFLLGVSYFWLRVLNFPFWRRRRRNSIVFPSVSDDLAGLTVRPMIYVSADIFFVDSHPRERCVRVHNFAFYRNSVASSKCPSSYATTNCRRKDQRSKFRVRHHRA